MAQFDVIGKGQSTGRKRCKTYSARTEDDAKAIAVAEGTVVESVRRLPDPPPAPATERQIAYARSLGLTFPTDITLSEMSDLIDRQVRGDVPAPEWLLAYVREQGVYASRYTGHGSCHERLFMHLIQEGYEIPFARWFLIHVLRDIRGGYYDNPFDHGFPIDRIDEFAHVLACDETFLKSARRYGGERLIHMGEYTGSDGHTSFGGTKRTYAYKAAAELIRAHLC